MDRLLVLEHDSENSRILLINLVLEDDFKQHHFALIDLVDDETVLEAEQAMMDKHDADVADLTVRLQGLFTPSGLDSSLATTDERRPLSRKFARIRTGLTRIDEAISPTEPPVERSLLTQYQSELSDYKKDLAILYDEIVATDITDEDERFATHSMLETLLSDTSDKVRKSIASTSTDTTHVSNTTNSSGVKR